jgi:hypothetical protein
MEARDWTVVEKIIAFEAVAVYIFRFFPRQKVAYSYRYSALFLGVETTVQEQSFDHLDSKPK